MLTTAIKQGIDPYSTYYESKPLDLNLPEYGHWEVHTADEGYQGTINLKQATVTSDNTVFAQLDLDVGPQNVAATAKSMGITTHLEGLPAEGIGGLKYGVSPLELSDAYATLASGGIRHRPVAIAKVVRPGGVVEHPQNPETKRILSPAVAWQVTRLLRDNITEGTGTAAYTGCVGQAGKTGTTDNETDAWFSGYQPNLATAVWVGYPQSNAISMTDVQGITVFGGTFPAEIWHSLYANAGVPCDEFHQPEEQIEWAPGYGAVHGAGAGDRGGEEGQRWQRQGRSGRRTARPELGRRLQPERLRPRRRPGTCPPPTPATPEVRRPRTGRRRRPGSRQVTEHRRGSGLCVDVGGVRRLPRGPLDGAAARRAGRRRADPDRRAGLRLRPGPALPRRLQLRRLRPPRGEARARPIRQRAGRGADRPRLRPRHLDRNPERLRPPLHARDLPARLAAGVGGDRGAEGARRDLGPRPRLGRLPPRRPARRRRGPGRRLRRPQPLGPGPRRRRRPQRRPRDAAGDARRRRPGRPPRGHLRRPPRGERRDQVLLPLHRPLRLRHNPARVPPPFLNTPEVDGPKTSLYLWFSARQRGGVSGLSPGWRGGGGGGRVRGRGVRGVRVALAARVRARRGKPGTDQPPFDPGHLRPPDRDRRGRGAGRGARPLRHRRRLAPPEDLAGLRLDPRRRLGGLRPPARHLVAPALVPRSGRCRSSPSPATAASPSSSSPSPPTSWAPASPSRGFRGCGWRWRSRRPPLPPRGRRGGCRWGSSSPCAGRGG